MPRRKTTRKQLEDRLDDAFDLRVQETAQQHMPQAIETLNQLMVDPDIADSVRRGAANDLIEHGQERAKPGALGTPAVTGGKHVQINIIRFSGAPAEKLITDVVEDVEEAIVIATEAITGE